MGQVLIVVGLGLEPAPALTEGLDVVPEVLVRHGQLVRLHDFMGASPLRRCPKGAQGPWVPLK